MGVKNIHVVLILVSIVLFLGFGYWALQHDLKVWATSSFILAAAVFGYFIQFVKKMKAL